MKFKKPRVNLHILIPLYLILMIGIFMVYSSSKIWANYIYNDATFYLKRQLIFFILERLCLLSELKLI